MCTIGIRLTGTDLDDRPERFAAVLEDVGRAGYEAVEILPDDFDLIIGGKLRGHTLDKLDEILGGYRFDISVHVPLRLNLFDRERDIHMEVLRRCLDICDRLEAGILVYHPGRGNFPFEAFFGALCGYRGIYLFEPGSRYFNPAKIRFAFEAISRLIENAGANVADIRGGLTAEKRS
jgi:sugar phosphate isomerase/epimerase